MPSELVDAFMLHVNGDPIAVVATLEAAKRDAQPHIDVGREVSVQNTSGRVVEWYYDPTDATWVFTDRPAQRPSR